MPSSYSLRYASDPEFRDKERIRHAEVYARTREARMAKIKEWRTANKERIKARHLERMASDPEYASRTRAKYRKYSASRRACLAAKSA